MWCREVCYYVAIVGRIVEGLYIQRGREARDACIELVKSSWLIVDALRVVVS